MLWTTTAVYLVVLAYFMMSLFRGRRRSAAAEPASRALGAVVGGAVAVTVIILFGLFITSLFTGRRLAAFGAPSAVTIAVTGHQWWWEIEYEDAVPARRVITANEIHIPTGRPIALKVTSHDVIHSFWAPNLQGKRDLIPGYTTAIWMQADREGVFRGQCAEFCGRQHAHMAFEIVAESPSRFAQWLDSQRQNAHAPGSPEERRGYDVFMAARCAGCHSIQGSEAHGLVGPDLTHVGSRLAIGAGILPNRRGHLAGWISNPQALKPGNVMPPNPLASDDLIALLTYLESLK
jgi:cytochrome c oxidase subunit 2